MNKNYYFLSFVLSFFVSSFLFSCGNADKKKEEMADSLAKAKPVEVNKVMGIAIIEPADRIAKLASESSGVIENINVKTGQVITKGQVILTLNNDLEQAQIVQAQSKIGTQKQAIAAAESNLNLLRTQLDKARRDANRDQELFDGKAITKDVLDNSKYTIENLDKQIANQKVAIQQQQARIAEINADIKYFQTLLGKKEVRAMQSGTLLTVNVHQGEYLSSNQVIAEFAPSGPTIALTEIDELFASKVKLGQKAEVRNQGSEEVLARGTVVLTSPYLRKKSLFSENSNNLEDRRVREIRVQLDDASKVILGGRVECWIDTKN
jgi:HlyD family secretion protein